MRVLFILLNKHKGNLPSLHRHDSLSIEGIAGFQEVLQCEECENYRDMFGLPLQMPWSCYNCRTENQGSKECYACHCGRDWADYLTYKDVKLSEDSKKWICPKCAFKNGLHEGVCCKCKSSCIAIQQGLSRLPLFLKNLLFRS